MRDHLQPGTFDQRQTIGERVPPQMPRHVARAVTAVAVQPVVFEREIQQHDAAERRRSAQELGVVGHVLEHVAQDDRIERLGRSGMEVAAEELDARMASARHRDIGRGNVEPHLAPAGAHRERCNQLASGTANLERTRQRLRFGQEAQEVRQLELAHLDVDLSLFERTAAPPRDILGVFVIERGEVDR